MLMDGTRDGHPVMGPSCPLFLKGGNLGPRGKFGDFADFLVLQAV